MPRISRLSYYLRNRAAAHAVAGSPGGAVGLATRPRDPSDVRRGSFGRDHPGFSVASEYLRFPGYRPQENGIVITADWLSHAELVIVAPFSPAR